MAKASGIGRLKSDFDPVFLLPRPKIPRQSTQRSFPDLPIGDEIPSELNSDSYVQCINCLDMISAKVINNHRNACSSFVDLNISSAEALELNRAQFIKFRQYLETHLEQNQFLGSSDAQMIRTLLKISETMTDVKMDYSRISDLHETVKDLLESYKTNNSTQIIIRRLLALIKTHINILQSNTVQQRKSKMNNLKNKLKRFQRKSIYSRECNDLKLDVKKIDEINSQIKSKKASSGRYTESETTTEGKNSKAISENEYGDFKQYFYGICLQLKMQMNEFSPGQAVSISFLYEKATSQNIEPENWSQFISEQLNDPSNWKAATVKKPPLIKKPQACIY